MNKISCGEVPFDRDNADSKYGLHHELMQFFYCVKRKEDSASSYFD